MFFNSVQSFVIENCNGPTIENGLNYVCLHPLSRTFTFTFYLRVADEGQWPERALSRSTVRFTGVLCTVGDGLLL